MTPVSQYQRIRAGSNVIDGADYKETLLSVAHIAAEYLAKTLGPFAHTTVIDDGSFRYSTKDGWSLASRLTFNDPTANSLFYFIRSISFSLVSKVGDGTTTAIVGADKFVEQWMNDAALQDVRQKDILDALDALKEKVIADLHEQAHPIDPSGDFEDIYRIAYTSSNSDESLARMIQEIYQKTGNPNIYVDFANVRQTKYEIQNGYKLDCNPKMLQHFINTDSGEYKVGPGDCMGFFFNHNLTYSQHRKIVAEIFRYINEVSVARKHRTVAVLFAPYFDDTLAETIKNSNEVDISQNHLPLMLMVQVPQSNTNQQHFFSDACVINNAIVIDAPVVEAYTRLTEPENFTEESQQSFLANFANLMTVDGHTPSPSEFISTYAANIHKATFGKNFVLFEEYDTESQRYQTRLKEIEQANQKALEEAAVRTSALDREFMDAHMRYVRFFGSMGTIFVGGESDLERKCKKDSVDDAVLACRSAFESGYVRGMNLATLCALRKQLPPDLNLAHPDKNYPFTMEQILALLLYNSFLAVVAEIFRNAYPFIESPYTGSVEFTDTDLEAGEKITYNDTVFAIVDYALDKDYGFDMVSMKYEHDDALTVVNSVNTDIEILKAIISILGYVMTSDQMLTTTKVYDKETARQIVLADDYAKYKNMAEAFRGTFLK